MESWNFNKGILVNSCEYDVQIVSIMNQKIIQQSATNYDTGTVYILFNWGLT